MEERPESTYPCSHCGRNFSKQSLERHEPVCRKMAMKKRKVFDSGKQRAQGSDVPLKDVRKVQEEIKKNSGHFKPPKTEWRERHDQFMTVVQSAKGVDYALKTGTPLPPPPKSTVPSDYVQCEYCGRNFNRNAAERHVPFCKEQHARQVSKPTPGAGSKQKNVSTPGPRRQPVTAAYGDESKLRGKASSATTNGNTTHDPYGEEDGKRESGRNPRSTSAGRQTSTQSRVPVAQRRGISPVTRIPTYTRQK